MGFKMDNQDLVCARKACQRPLDRGCYAIYNEPSTGIPRKYCVRCGRTIVEANPGIRHEISVPVRKPSVV